MGRIKLADNFLAESKEPKNPWADMILAESKEPTWLSIATVLKLFFFAYHLGVLLISHVPLMSKNRTIQIVQLNILFLFFNYFIVFS